MRKLSLFKQSPIIAYGHFNYIGGKPVNRKIHGCLEIPDLFRMYYSLFI